MEQRYLRNVFHLVYLTLSFALLTPGLVAQTQANWQTIMRGRLPLFGHRNWIVIADSAYPDQSAEGIETVVSNSDQITVLREVLSALGQSKHVRPILYIDQEFKFINDSDAPGASTYRNQLSALLGGRSVTTLPHDQLIAKLDSISKTFRVLIIKTNLTVPYTTVFLQLDCAYWSSESEEKLRARMSAKEGK